MTIHMLIESIIIPKSDKDQSLVLGESATAADAIEKMEQEGMTGSLSADEVLGTHMLICNSRHITPETKLNDGDTLMVIKTLLGG